MLRAGPNKLFCLVIKWTCYYLSNGTNNVFKNALTGLVIQKVGNHWSILYDAPYGIVLYCIVSDEHMDRIVFFTMNK